MKCKLIECMIRIFIDDIFDLNDFYAFYIRSKKIGSNSKFRGDDAAVGIDPGFC
jgi:hypothetical protein